MKLHDIKAQSWSLLIANYYICEHCQIVDRDEARSKRGHRCSRCNNRGGGARYYFHLPILSLIDLIQEFYQLEPTSPPPDGISRRASHIAENHQVAVLVFFCTFGEVLLQFFLEKQMNFLGIPKTIQTRLLNDNLFVKQRIEKVFPDLIGEKWNSVLVTLPSLSGFTNQGITRFYMDAANTRNLLLHKGDQWAVPEELIDQCVEHIEPMLYLFVSLHNKFLVNPLATNG